MNNEPIYNLLNTIDYPEDSRKLNVEQLPEVCNELKKTLLKSYAAIQGHFAASLGTVELTVALHYVYNTPYDRIVWDVGHQAYGHKILTGRRDFLHQPGSWEESVLFLHRRRVRIRYFHLRTCIQFYFCCSRHGSCRCSERRFQPSCHSCHR